MEALSNKDKFLKALKAHLIDKYGNLNKASVRLNLSPGMLSMILSGKRKISSDLKRSLIMTGLKPYLFKYLEDETKESEKRKDNFILILEQQKDIITECKYYLEMCRERTTTLSKRVDSLEKDILYYIKQILKYLQLETENPTVKRGFSKKLVNHSKNEHK